MGAPPAGGRMRQDIPHGAPPPTRADEDETGVILVRLWAAAKATAGVAGAGPARARARSRWPRWSPRARRHARTGSPTCSPGARCWWATGRCRRSTRTPSWSAPGDDGRVPAAVRRRMTRAFGIASASGRCWRPRDDRTAWVLLGVAAGSPLAFGLYRAWADGRFRGTHPVRGAVAPEPTAATAVDDVDVLAGTAHAGCSWASGRRCCSSPRPSALRAAPPAQVLAGRGRVGAGVRHVEIDAEHHLDLVRRLGVLRTPTPWCSTPRAQPRRRRASTRASPGGVAEVAR